MEFAKNQDYFNNLSEEEVKNFFMKKNHFLSDKHNWGKVVPDKNVNKILKFIHKALKYGETKKYINEGRFKGHLRSLDVIVNGVMEEVQVTFFIKEGVLQVSNGWVK